MKPPPPWLEILRDTIVSSVRRDEPDLTARQLAVLLICCLDAEPQTVRGLASALRINKPAITRAVDRLAELRFAKRKSDQSDRRSVLIVATLEGRAFVQEFKAIMVAAARHHTMSSVAATPSAQTAASAG